MNDNTYIFIFGIPSDTLDYIRFDSSTDWPDWPNQSALYRLWSPTVPRFLFECGHDVGIRGHGVFEFVEVLGKPTVGLHNLRAPGDGRRKPAAPWFLISCFLISDQGGIIATFHERPLSVGTILIGSLFCIWDWSNFAA